jgi:two-component system OmpR family response regulator
MGEPSMLVAAAEGSLKEPPGARVLRSRRTDRPATPMRLLLLEDDAILGDGLRDFLRADGHTVDWCRSLSQAEGLRGEPFDALLVDWQLLDGSGLAWVRERRTRGDTTPVLMLTARDLLSDRVLALDDGADDYLVKPFAPEELVARLRAVRRRSAGAAQSRLRVADVELDLAARAAFVQGRQVDLTAREWALAEALALRAGRIVPKADLDRLVLGLDAAVTSNALEVHVSSLRRKLGRELIETVRGLGYRIPA